MKYILIGIGGIIFLFLAFTFGEWNFNPHYWDSADRGLFAGLSTVMLILTVGFYLNKDS